MMLQALKYLFIHRMVENDMLISNEAIVLLI